MRTPKPSTPAAIAAAKAKEAKAAAAPSDELLEKYRSLYARTRELEHGQMKDDDDEINRWMGEGWRFEVDAHGAQDVFFL